MNPIFDFLVEPYQNYNTLDIVLEAVAVLLGLLSVWFAKRDHIAVYPSGMLSTGIFVYILFQANLLGDMLINAYFFVMSIYGWYFWIQKEGNQVLNPIAKMNSKEFKWAIVLFFGAVLFVIGIYLFFDKWTDWTAPVDTFTTALFFVGMWLMARRKIEHWIFWIVGDVISVPLYLYKGLGLTSIQYLIFTLIAILGYIQWKKAYNKELQTA
jgi:nicotinamide mononucleotide transporter